MSAPTNGEQDPNSLSYYAPKRARAVRLEQMSQAAATPAQQTLREDVFDETLVAANDKEAVPWALAPRSSEPERPPAFYAVAAARPRWRTLVGAIAAVAAAALIAFLAVGGFQHPAPTAQQASVSRQPASAASRPATPVEPTRVAVAPQLSVRDLRVKQGEPAPFGASVQGPVEGVTVAITGLPPGMTLSKGRDAGVDGWQVPARDLSQTWIVPAPDFSGAADLLLELRRADETVELRRTMHVEWVAAQPPPSPPPSPAPRELEDEEIAMLLGRGKTFIAAGDIVAARVPLQRAAEANSAEAALILGATYDPFVLRELRAVGLAADLPTARSWYERAKALGSPDAPRRLEVLASIAR